MTLNSLAVEFIDKLSTVINQFKTNLDINQFEQDLREHLHQFAEDILLSIVQPLLESKEFLAVLKTLAPKHALRFHGYVQTNVRFFTGRAVSLRVPYFIKAAPKKRRRTKGKKRRTANGRHFGLQYLGFISRCTPSLCSMAVQAAVLCPSFAIARQLLLQHGISLGEKTISRLCDELGTQAMDFRGSISLSDTDTAEGRIVLICPDGGRLRERTTKRGRIPENAKRRGYHTDWREPKQFVIQLLESDGTSKQDILPIYDATMGDIDAMFDLLETYLKLLNLQKADKVVFCADGAKGFWKRAQTLARKLGVAKLYEVIDYTHAKQNLFDFINYLPKKLPIKQRTATFRRWKELLWENKLDDLYIDIANSIQSGKKREKALKRFKGYFLDNRCRMQYSRFDELKLPIGSGCVESAIRRVINMRMKSPGIFWKRRTAEFMLFLRNQLLSGRWNIMIHNLLNIIRFQRSPVEGAVCH